MVIKADDDSNAQPFATVYDAAREACVTDIAVAAANDQVVVVMAAAGTLVRGTVGMAAAAGVTIGLFILMYSLIESAHPQLNESKMVKIQDITMPRMQIHSRLAEAAPSKPEQPAKPPPEQAKPEQQNFDVKTSIDVAYQPKADIKVGTGGMVVSDGEYLPLVKVAPMYPPRAQSRGIQGYCIVSYTVTRSGATKDVRPVDCQPAGYFEEASVRAAQKFKYKPRVVDGEPIAVKGVENKFKFQLSQ